MTDYRLVSLLDPEHVLPTDRSTRRVFAPHDRESQENLPRQGHTSVDQVDNLTAEELDSLFADGRRTPSEDFVAFDVAATV